MSKPYIHAQTDVKAFGGKVEDYLPLHDFMDSSKAHIADPRHRAILHSSFGIFILEKVFGTNITNSDGKKVSVREIGERHCIQDLGCIPSVQDYLEHMELKDWMITRTNKDRPTSMNKVIKSREERSRNKVMSLNIEDTKNSKSFNVKDTESQIKYID